MCLTSHFGSGLARTSSTDSSSLPSLISVLLEGVAVLYVRHRQRPTRGLGMPPRRCVSDDGKRGVNEPPPFFCAEFSGRYRSLHVRHCCGPRCGCRRGCWESASSYCCL